MNYHDASKRYRDDPTYRSVVDALVQLMRDLKLTPGEVRDAASLAALKFEEERHCRDMLGRYAPLSAQQQPGAAEETGQ